VNSEEETVDGFESLDKALDTFDNDLRTEVLHVIVADNFRNVP